MLDRSCKLEPEYAEEIVAEKRTIRPPGTWTVTAKLTTVTGSGQEVLLVSLCEPCGCCPRHHRMVANIGTKKKAQREDDIAWLETFVHVI